MSGPTASLHPTPTPTPPQSRNRPLRRPSLVVTPAVVAHRGASGQLPEHTLAAYRAAIRRGVDDIELDLVATRDGVLVARHENELSRTTDVAGRPRFAHLRTTREVDGHPVTGWFCEDLTFAELKSLGARERMPDLRRDSASYDGHEGVPSLNEVLAMVTAESMRRGSAVGVALELKHVAHLARRGIDVVAALLSDLARHGLDHPRSRVTVMSFETGVLRALAGRTRLPLVQLVGRLDDCPPDLRSGAQARTYGDLLRPEGLAQVDEYADGLGLWSGLVTPGADGEAPELERLVDLAHRHWLTVHVWTLRAENHFLPPHLRIGTDPAAHGDLAALAQTYLDAGVDGLITDHPGVVLDVRDAYAS